MRKSAPLLITLLLATPALAGDGVLEINQTCAMNTGCFAGDTAGFPVTIATSGSYRLTSNLLVSDANTNVIRLDDSTVTNVSIDLGGFEIRGPVVCSGNPKLCTPSGTGGGIRVSEYTTNTGVSVRNGSITGMGAMGVLLGGQAEVTGLRAGSNGGTGIIVGARSAVSESIAYQNGIVGIGAIDGTGTRIWNCTAYENGTIGINALPGATVSNSSAHRNGTDGISAGLGSTLSGNSASENGGDGITAESGSTIIGNASYDNGDATNSSLDDGIDCDSGCIVKGNAVRLNSGHGLNLGASSAYSDNAVSVNITGQVTGTGSANSKTGNHCVGTGAVSVNCP